MRMNPNVHQIAITDHDPPRLGGYSAEATRSVRQAFPGARYRLWGRADGEAFIDQHFTPEVAWAFRCLRPYAYKADLLKLCLLHAVGGWYVDVGVRILRSPAALFENRSAPSFVLFRSTGPMDLPWNCSLALLYGEAGSPVFTTAIDEIVDNCQTGRYGATPLSPTMSPFGRAVAGHRLEAGVRTGVVVDVAGQDFNRGFEVAPLGLVAARKPRGLPAGEVAAIGLEGGNDYLAMWRSRSVYGLERPPGGWTAVRVASAAESTWVRNRRRMGRTLRAARRAVRRARRSTACTRATAGG
jgi:hypothetical protein